MTPYEQALKAGKELAENAQEILANLKSVRGEAFSNAVAAAFEVRQLVDILARIASESQDNPFVVDMTVAGCELVASIGAKTVLPLTNEEVTEVLDMADKLHERRMNLMRSIKKAG